MSAAPPRRRLRTMPGKLATPALLALALLGSAAAAVPIAAPAEPEATAAAGRLAGSTLTEALLELRGRGLKIVFTSSLVRPEMTVASEPTATEPRRILDQILAPHGLAAYDGPNETVVVVPADAAGTTVRRSSLAGSVRSRRDAGPVAGAVVRIVESGREVASEADGSFAFLDPGPGPLTIEVRAPGYLAETLTGIAVAEGEHAELSIALVRSPVIREELVVTPSRVSLLREEPVAPLGLSRDDILALPHLGDDFFRAITLLPGAIANDVSAQFHVRGGRRDETLVLVDGQELYDAYHLKDFDSAVSFIAPATLGTADLTTGGFSAQYGDRMSGVLDMTTVTPTGKPSFRVGAGFLSAHAGGAGAFRGDRGSWIAEVRRGSTDLVGRLLGNEDPQYWDAFVKLHYRFGDRNSLQGNLLHSADKLDFREFVDGELKVLQTEYDSSYYWATHQTILGSDLFFETAGSVARITRDRRGLELEEDAQFEIADRRDSDVLGLRQEWNLRVTARQRLAWGWQARSFETEYDYAGTRNFDNPLAVIRHDFGQPAKDFVADLREEHTSAHLSHRVRVSDPLTVELGLRFDRHTQTDESFASPRLNLAYALGRNDVLRIAWGRFNQSQRPYELLVEDGESGFHPVERSEHRVVGFEKHFDRAGGRGLSLRIEAYQRLLDNPRPRYENLFEPLNNFPEVEPDRVRVAPERSLAEGVEIFVRGRIGPRVGWWANYAWASTEDRVDGRWVPRLFDQTHTLNLDLDFRLGDHWRVNMAWRYHTGWPTTPVGLREEPDEEGETVFVPVLGPLNSERHPSYHRLDLRASRSWRFRAFTLDAFVDVQNAYNRKNSAGFDYEIDDELGTIDAMREAWIGTLPSAGISFQF